MDICIIGGGLGGLTAAIALRQRGANVLVLEQAPQIAEVGAGLQISPNGACVLRALGLGDALQAISVRAMAVSLRDYAKGREVTRLDLTRLPEDQTYGLVHRADVIEMLRSAALAAGVEIRLNALVTGCDPAAGAVTLDDGEVLRTELIVGADGVKSVLRPILNGAEAPFFTGQTAWRVVVPNTMSHPDEARVTMGKGRHLVSYPLRDSAWVNLVAVQERSTWSAEGWSHHVPAQTLRHAFRDFGGQAAELMKDLPAEIGHWGLFRHPVAKQWSRDRAVLLGDAAHPTLPFLAQGANMAFEDAFALAHCIDPSGDLTAGLARYQMLRRPRVQRVIAAASGNARKYHLRNPIVRGAAHLGLRSLGLIAPDMVLRQFDWLYRYDITKQV